MEQPAQLLTTGEAAAFRRSRRNRRMVAATAMIVVIVTVVLVGPPVVRHLDTVAGFTLAGADVDWQLNGSNWRRGGVTRLGSTNGKTIIGDPALERLKDLHNLEALDLSDCELITERGLSALKDLRSIKELDISRTMPVKQFLGRDRAPKKLTDEALVPLQNLTQLTNLSLAGNLITDDGLANLSGLTKLESLDLSGTLVTDAGLKHLLRLKRLRNLILVDTKVTKEGALAFEQVHGGVTNLNTSLDYEPDPTEAIENP